MAYLIVACTLAAQLLVAAYFYPSLPESIVTHWDAAGIPDGYSPKLLGLLAIPAITAAVVALFAALPGIDPLGANVKKFRKQYDTFIAVIALFMLAVQADVALWNSGARFSQSLLLPAGLAVLYFYTGVMLAHTRRNWFVGIRTPWTMSSDAVWRKTHERAAKLFKAAAAVSLAGVLLPGYAILLAVAPVIFAAAYSAAYSYVEYSKSHSGRR